ncbi:hypothetical protein [Paenibacillus radicis (ex Xue et al. 2023)]|uniref:Uncharacterized protein n=1 Tax=Paenibacillus radicis (ex Xue et al. 2023) TaxID=2972489 RepID=A0ABT1YKG5_9BACL|nr:hypothetical protein [Paenibacillus radicis (ex Xue et al. 2023)]MCR8633679.1 hypothetical protein [Paenibacillus radicis (ex Xue et al. 2023)]
MVIASVEKDLTFDYYEFVKETIEGGRFLTLFQFQMHYIRLKSDCKDGTVNTELSNN